MKLLHLLLVVWTSAAIGCGAEAYRMSVGGATQDAGFGLGSGSDAGRPKDIGDDSGGSVGSGGAGGSGAGGSGGLAGSGGAGGVTASGTGGGAGTVAPGSGGSGGTGGAAVMTDGGGPETATPMDAADEPRPVDAGVPVNCAGTPAYILGTVYMPGQRARNIGNLYQCRPYPYSGWCGQDKAYEPGVGYAWVHAWTLVGGCP